jgi:hypothetical protein
MQPNFRRAVIAAVIVASLAPGLAQARTFHGSPRALAVEMGRDGGFFSTVWSLLTDVLAGRIPVALPGVPMTAKDTTDPGDNGGRLDPSGTPTVVMPPSSPNG